MAVPENESSLEERMAEGIGEIARINGWSEDSGVFREAEECMAEAFPPEEQVARRKLLRYSRSSGTPGAVDLWGQGGHFIGFSYWQRLPGKRNRKYIAFLAVDKRMRGKGAGSRILQLLTAEDSAAEWLLGVERPLASAPNRAERIRRLGFYLRNGWRDTGMHAVDGGVDYELLSLSEETSADAPRAIVTDFWDRLTMFTG